MLFVIKHYLMFTKIYLYQIEHRLLLEGNLVLIFILYSYYKKNYQLNSIKFNVFGLSNIIFFIGMFMITKW
jgi:hypothetical protein